MGQRRKRNRKKKKIPRIWISISVAFVFVIALIYILNLPIWQIKEIVVNGAKMLPPDYVRGISGIPLSENLFFADLSRAKKNLKKVAAIKSFRFHRLPPQTVLISITEREPLATLVLRDRSVVIDSDGVIINHNPDIYVDVSNLAELPVVTGIACDEDRLDEVSARLITRVLLTLRSYLSAGRIQLDMGGLKEIGFLLDDLLKVRLGSAEKIDLKMEVFEVLLKQVDGKWAKVEYIDVRYPDYPVIKFK